MAADLSTFNLPSPAQKSVLTGESLFLLQMAPNVATRLSLRHVWSRSVGTWKLVHHSMAWPVATVTIYKIYCTTANYGRDPTN